MWTRRAHLQRWQRLTIKCFSDFFFCTILSIVEDANTMKNICHKMFQTHAKKKKKGEIKIRTQGSSSSFVLFKILVLILKKEVHFLVFSFSVRL